MTAQDLLIRTAYIGAKVYVNTELIEVGTGAQSTPFNSFDTAKDYCETNGIYVMVVIGECTITSTFKNFIVEGVSKPLIHTNSQDISGTKFYQCRVDGTYTGSIIAQECFLQDGFSLDGSFESCRLGGDLFCLPSATVLLANCFSGIAGLSRPTISMNTGSLTKLSVRSYSGGLTIKDADHVDDECTVEIAQGSLTFDSSCILGTMVARGMCKFVDETTGATVIDETSYNLVADVNQLLDYNEGSWRIITNQMIYYRRDGTELMRFDLFDSSGQPITRGATQRVRV